MKHPEHIAIICDFNNWMVGDGVRVHANCQSFDGYEITKKKDADHYALIRRDGSEVTVKTVWLKKI
jgi:hypothetical protein